MLIKYYPFILLLNQYVSGSGVELFCVKNGFKYLNDEINLEPHLEEFITQTKWLKQKLDHFNATDQRDWKMRYFKRLSFWKLNGPIYLFLGGEGPVSPRWADTGIMYELAKETNGALYVSEHRYYGESKPLNGTDAEALKYLSARQALADNAYLLKYLKHFYIYKKSKVVVVGGSYSGNLAAWMKLLYPDLVDAAIASSGPVLAKMDFYEYLEKVSDNYELYGTKKCLGTIKKIFKRYDKLIQTADGIKLLKEEENICEKCNLSAPENQQIFFGVKVGEFMRISQYGTTEQIKGHCQSLQNESIPRTPPEESTRNNCTCYDFDETIKGYYSKENEWIISWLYQTCTEFGYFQTTSSDDHPFTNNMPLNFYIRMCHKLFGPDFDEERVIKGVAAVNDLYGALHLNVTNVVFSNGNLDPWSTLSVLEALSYNAPAVVIPRASHCRDLFSNRDGDIEELKEARKDIKNLVKKWIGAEC
ncbi:putative serine protease K12H4.7 [Maniola hyperantus]|uniref:putative serine protease K12H4.7 n=1 Tax=Aphantopus hyperantus TaxID=2795564 RepID=UPI0015682938|nr:putative serine protease K12H4.7 [Maniola hyperantus]